jgi:protein required for attachment to host cells
LTVIKSGAVAVGHDPGDSQRPEDDMANSTWGLALDGARARIIRNLEDRTEGKPIPGEIALEMKRKHAGDIMADRPGRAFSSEGPGRSAMEYGSDPVAEEERAFCGEVLDLLESHLGKGDFDRLVVAAPPDTLGRLRDQRSKRIAEATVAEASKDYLNLSPKDLRARLAEMMPSRLA